MSTVFNKKLFKIYNGLHFKLLFNQKANFSTKIIKNKFESQIFFSDLFSFDNLTLMS